MERKPRPKEPKPMDFRVIRRDDADVLQQWRPYDLAQRKYRWVDVWEGAEDAPSPPATEPRETRARTLSP